MKQTLKNIIVAAIALLTISATVTAQMTGTNAVTINCTNTVQNQADIYGAYTSGNTNYTGAVTIYFGAVDCTNNAAAWGRSTVVGSGLTNGQTFAATIYNLAASATTYARTYALESTSGAGAWSTTTAISVVSPAEVTFRENLRQGKVTLGVVSIGGSSYTASALTSGAIIRSNLLQTITITNGVGGSWTFTVVTNQVVPASGITTIKLTP